MLLSVKLDIIRKSELNKKKFVVAHYCHVSSLTDFKPHELSSLAATAASKQGH